MDLIFDDITEGSCMDSMRDIFFNQLSAESDVYVKIQIFVLVTFFVLVFQLGFRLKRFASGFFRGLAWVSYLLVPVLISYVLGLLGHKGPQNFNDINSLRFAAMYGASVWVVFLLFSYAGFDNLTAFSVHEGMGRSKLVVQFLMQFVLIVLLLLNESVLIIPLLCVFLMVCLKFMERLVSLGHAAGVTPRIKRELTRVIEFMNEDKVEDAMLDPTTMHGFNYLVGPRFSTVNEEGTSISDGVTLEKIWGCNEDDERRPWLLSSGGDPGGHLKDSCLSFSLFWLLLGKFRGYPLYKKDSGSRMKAWKLVRDGLLAKDGEHERVFRVIEVELAFLRDYFHSKYIFFYLNGFFWKLNILAFPVMLWWFTRKFDDFIDKHPPKTDTQGYFNGAYDLTRATTKTLIVSLSFLEVVQLVVFLASRWFKVTLLCYYVKVKSEMPCGLSSWFLEKIGALYRGSSWFPHWKRELPQYSLVQSCTSLPRGPIFIQSIAAFLGIPFPKPGKKKGDSVKLPKEVKEAVVISLQRMDGPKVSKRITSLRQHGVEKELSSAHNHEKDVETILVWHIATCFCEMLPYSQENKKALQHNSNYVAATSLSMYCAYLLTFSPSLTSIPSLEAESTCLAVIEDARKFFNKNKSICDAVVEGTGGMINKMPCTSGETNTIESEKYTMMMNEIKLDKEAGNIGNSILKKDAILGKELTERLGIDKGKGWEIMAEFWAEMIIFLAQSNNNEMEHAEKLSEGGEFITHLWALLIHAGIESRVDMATKLPTRPQYES